MRRHDQTDVHDFLAVVDLTAERAHREVGFPEAEGMRAERTQPVVMRLQYLERDFERTRGRTEAAEYLQFLGDDLVCDKAVDGLAVLESCEHDPSTHARHIERLQHRFGRTGRHVEHHVSHVAAGDLAYSL